MLSHFKLQEKHAHWFTTHCLLCGRSENLLHLARGRLPPPHLFYSVCSVSRSLICASPFSLTVSSIFFQVILLMLLPLKSVVINCLKLSKNYEQTNGKKERKRIYSELRLDRKRTAAMNKKLAKNVDDALTEKKNTKTPTDTSIERKEVRSKCNSETVNLPQPPI